MSKISKTIVLGRFQKLTFAKDSGVSTVVISELELNGLLDYFNVGKSRERKRVVGILEQMLGLGSLQAPIWDEDFKEPMMVGNRLNPQLENIAPEKYRLELEIEKRTALLNRELSRYRFTPYVYNSGVNALIVTWHRDWRREYRPGKTAAQIYEGQAIDWILNLARSRRLHRLRRCDRCKNWLYAKFQHQNFCSQKCQQQHYTQSEDWKARRRKYMRDYYQRNHTKPGRR